MLGSRRTQRIAERKRQLLGLMIDPDVSDTDKYQAVIEAPDDWVSDDTTPLGRAASKIIREIDSDRNMILALGIYSRIDDDGRRRKSGDNLWTRLLSI